MTTRESIAIEEHDRLKALYKYNILDTPAEQDFDDLAALAAQILGTPMAYISLIDRDRQWFKSRLGITDTETPRDISFCTHTILGHDVMIVPDASQDKRFQASPPVTGDPKIRFYAGAPLTMPGGEEIGTLCAVDRVPHVITESQKKALAILARQVVAQLELRKLARDQERRSKELSELHELSNLLNSCVDLEEAGSVLAHRLKRLLSGDAGMVSLVTGSAHSVEALARWGNEAKLQSPFPADACWALRRGRPHIATRNHGDVNCSHLQQGPRDISICVPMFARGEALGVLSVVRADQEDALHQTETPEERTWIVQTAAELIAVGLAGLRLREKLQHDSLRDPLTSLFNRRYMEDTLLRELARAERLHQLLAVVMLDIDHFKEINDVYGHHAGDLYLQALAEKLLNTFRKDAIVCRYGGEEFVVILPQAQVEAVCDRVKELVDQVSHLSVSFGDKTLPQATISAGIAIYPQNGTTSDELFRAADNALYEAKQSGRHCVVLPGETRSQACASGV